jgi:hypothetical protein
MTGSRDSKAPERVVRRLIPYLNPGSQPEEAICMLSFSIPQISPQRLAYLKTGLVTLGIYALNHAHSCSWVPAITTLIGRRCAHV